MTYLNKLRVKHLFAFLLLIFISKVSFAQKDTLVYYLKNSGQKVTTKDSADFVLSILPPDNTIDKNVYVIKGYYLNGRIRFTAGSLTNGLPLTLQGTYTDFFPNGNKMRIRNFSNGKRIGDIIQYYPNSKFYNRVGYADDIGHPNEMVLKDCSDSTGRVLAKDGNGYWIMYAGNFSHVFQQGKIVNGHRDSVWITFLPNGRRDTAIFKDGQNLRGPNGAVFTSVEQVPEFPGGLDAFSKFLTRNVIYPDQARHSGIHGRVIISFICEKDGSLTDVKVARGIGGGCDEEAVRVIKMSPRWKPGIQNGRPVRVAYNIPINFNLGN